MKRLLLALVVVLAASSSARAQSKVQGLVPDGTAPVGSVNPVGIAGVFSNSVKAIRVNATGDFNLGAVTSASTGTVILTDPAGAVYVRSSAINPALDTPSRISPAVTSNGTTAVTIKAVSGTKAVYVGALFFVNAGTVSHTVTVTSTGSATLVAAFTVGAAGTGILGEDGGMFASLNGEGLVYAIDAGGSATDVSVSGVVYQK